MSDTVDKSKFLTVLCYRRGYAEDSVRFVSTADSSEYYTPHSATYYEGKIALLDQLKEVVSKEDAFFCRFFLRDTIQQYLDEAQSEKQPAYFGERPFPLEYYKGKMKICKHLLQIVNQWRG